jgi:hypothetical protein
MGLSFVHGREARCGNSMHPSPHTTMTHDTVMNPK